MTKKMMASSLVIGTMFTLIGCGGGGSTASTPVATGTAYYIDSAVEGVDYTCGATSGVTGKDGSFTFEAGGSCTFYLGDIELRSVEASLLADGNKVYETDMRIARILQSLDSDGDASNGITVKSEFIAALAAAGISKLPDTLAEIEVMLAVIETAGGIAVSVEDAAEHMLKTLLINRTLYQHCKDNANEWIATLTFGKDGNLVMVDGEERETAAYRIEGNIIYTMEEGEEQVHTFAEATADTIKINESNGGTTTFYFSSEAAQASPATECGDEEDMQDPVNP